MLQDQPSDLQRSFPRGELLFRYRITEELPTIRELIGLVNTRAFVGTNPTGELITSVFPVRQAQPPKYQHGAHLRFSRLSRRPLHLLDTL